MITTNRTKINNKMKSDIKKTYYFIMDNIEENLKLINNYGKEAIYGIIARYR